MENATYYQIESGLNLMKFKLEERGDRYALTV